MAPPAPELQLRELFALALAQVQLRPDPLDSAVMLQALLQLRGEQEGNPNPGYAWTGDLHGVAQVHRLAPFAWLTDQLHQQVWAYLLALGFDPAQVAVHIQRSWPVVSAPGQGVGRHHHPNAHLSAVYYVNGDGTGRSGCLRFYPHLQANELVPGLAVGHGGPIAAGHPLNSAWVDLAPQAGLLVLFPSSTDHAVTCNDEDEELRLSVSFDLVITAPASGFGPGAGSGSRAGSAPEYLSPHPSDWSALAAPAGLAIREDGGAQIERPRGPLADE